MEDFRAQKAVDILLFASLSAALLSFGLRGGKLLKGDYVGLALGAGLILFLLTKKREALLAKDYGSAAVSLGFVFLLSRVIRLPSLPGSPQGFLLEFPLFFSAVVLLLLIAGLIISRNPRVIFNNLIDWSFLGALLFIYIFFPFVLLLAGGEKVAGYKTDLSLYLVVGEFFCFYLAINFLLRRGKYRRGFLVLFIILLLLVIWQPLGR